MLKAKGVRGGLYAAGRLAARFKRWELSGSASHWTLEAEAEQVDSFWIEQGALTLRLTVGSGEWIWRNVNASVHGETISIVGEGVPESR